MKSSRQPGVFVRDGEVFGNSRDVAAFFENRHDNVLRDIDNLIASEPDLALRGFTLRFFKSEESNESNDLLANSRTYRTFDMKPSLSMS